MYLKRAFVAVLAGCLWIEVGISAASDFSLDGQADYFASGEHLFYVWCPGTGDYRANADGLNAEESQMRLYNEIKAAGRTSCWPIWQGRVAALCCSGLRGTSNHDFFLMFFVSGNVQLSPEARRIVEQAAVSAKAQKPSIIEIAVPPDVPGAAPLFDARVSAIENVLSAEGVDSKWFAHRPLSEAETAVPGASSRAEIRIVQR